MSTYWVAVCEKCKTYHHLGQLANGVYAFGRGQHDREGRDAAARFVERHVRCGELRVVPEDYYGAGYRDAEVLSSAAADDCSGRRPAYRLGMLSLLFAVGLLMVVVVEAYRAAAAPFGAALATTTAFLFLSWRAAVATAPLKRPGAG